MIKIVTDSSCDLPKEFIERYGITVVPLTVTIDDKHYQDGVDITPEEFFEKMFAAKELPKTSQPSPATFEDVFSKFDSNDEILCITISSGLSGTHQSAVLAQDMTTAKVTVFDSLAASIGLGLTVVYAAELVEQGKSINEIVEKLTAYRDELEMLVGLDTVENIVKGGRLSKFSGSLAKVLNIKVILDKVDGKVEAFDKVRGKKKMFNRIIEVVKERSAGKDFSNRILGVTHAGNIGDAEELKQRLIEDLNPKDVIVNHMGATIGTYAGRDGLIISF